jgi:hypothetical protein
MDSALTAAVPIRLQGRSLPLIASVPARAHSHPDGGTDPAGEIEPAPIARRLSGARRRYADLSRQGFGPRKAGL